MIIVWSLVILVCLCVMSIPVVMAVGAVWDEIREMRERHREWKRSQKFFRKNT